MKRVLLAATAATVMLAVPAAAQERAVQPPTRGAGARGQTQDRAALERQVREALYQTVRTQVGLNDQQMAQLQRVDQRFEAQRREVFREEMQVRLRLRASLSDTAARNDAEITRSLDRLIQLQRRRVDLLEAEQRELATFMTPVQRARYQALQERVRRRMEEMRGGSPPQRGGTRRGRPPSE